MKITRRDFMKKTAAVSLTLGAAPFFPGIPLSFGAQQKTALAVVTGDRIPATKKALALLGGMEKFIKKGCRVALKPNMSFPHPPERATNTHPEVVATVAKMCIDAGAGEVVILDFPFNPPDKCLSLSGIADACKGMKNVYTLALTEEKFFTPFSLPGGKVLREVKLLKDVRDSDVLINLPTAKSHSTTGVSLGMKGLMGIVWDRRYFHANVEINQAIADLSSAVKVDLIVLDGSRALVNGGPSGPGTVSMPNTIIAGTDPVAVDALGVTLADWYNQKFTGSQVKHIAAAHRMGLGTMNLEDVAVLKARV
jgi:uncharacterized protein (DUF362 family)